MKAGVALLLGIGCTATGAPLDHWTYQTSDVAYANFTAAAFGDGKFVVSGYTSVGILLSSVDGIEWTPRSYGSTRLIEDIAHGDGKFVGVGSSGTVAVSTNAEDWTSFSLSNTAALNLNAIAHGDGRFVIVGDFLAGGTRRATSYASTDGLTWSNWIAETNSRLRDVAYGSGRFVAAADNSYTRYDPNFAVLVSSNGLDWSPRSTAPYVEVKAITYGNQQFVALARDGSTNAMLASPDGETWTPHVLTFGTSFIARMGFENGTYFAVGSSNQSRHTLFYSTNGADWQAKFIGPYQGNYFLDDITFGKGTFLVVGMPNTIAQSSSYTMAWFESVARPTAGAMEFDIGGEVGREYVLQYSTNLVDWREVRSWTNVLPSTRITDVSGPVQRRFYRVVTP